MSETWQDAPRVQPTKRKRSQRRVSLLRDVVQYPHRTRGGLGVVGRLRQKRGGK